MATPKDNTEVIRMMRDVKNSIWKSLTPMRASEYNFNDYVSSLTNTAGGGSSLLNPPTIATKLNFSGFEESHNLESKFHAFETPGKVYFYEVLSLQIGGCFLIRVRK